jgi:hypothetical protein
MSGLPLDEIKANARPMLVRLALVSHAPAGRMDAMPRTHGTPEHRRPPGEAHPEAERLAHRLAETLSRSEALAIVDEIRVELERATRRTMATSAIETREELDERIVEAVGWPVDLVAAAMRCPESWVRSARVAVGRSRLILFAYRSRRRHARIRRSPPQSPSQVLASAWPSSLSRLPCRSSGRSRLP